MLQSFKVFKINTTERNQRGNTIIDKGRHLDLQLDKARDFWFPFTQDSMQP